MNALIKNALLNNKILKVCSLILGYSLWSLMGNIYTQTVTQQVPVCFYNIPENMNIQSNPEIVSLHLSGKRSDLVTCTDLALHVDASALAVGEHKIMPSAQMLFLPKTVNLLQYKPRVISLTVSKKA